MGTSTCSRTTPIRRATRTAATRTSRGPRRGVLPDLGCAAAVPGDPAVDLRRGKILQTPKAATFCLSQRAEHIWEGVSSATTRSRPIINTRDEPHADAEKYRRLHVIVGDSNMAETTTMLKVGTAALVLEMIEAGSRSAISRWTTHPGDP